MADTSIEPLIADPHPDVPSEDEESEEVDEHSLENPGSFIWILTLCAGVSGLLFGYEYGVPLPFPSQGGRLVVSRRDSIHAHAHEANA